VRFKPRLFHATGSFKVRGALNKLRADGDEKRAGYLDLRRNHAQAVAWARAGQAWTR